VTSPGKQKTSRRLGLSKGWEPLPTWLSGLKVLESGLLVFDSVTLVLDSVTWSLAFGWLCALQTFPVGNLAQGVCQCKLNLIVLARKISTYPVTTFTKMVNIVTLGVCKICTLFLVVFFCLTCCLWLFCIACACT